MLVSTTNNVANSAKLGLHGLARLHFTIPVMENVEKAKSEFNTLNPNVDRFIDIYLKVFISICHEDPHRKWKQFL